MERALSLVTDKRKGEVVRRYLASIEALNFNLKIRVKGGEIHIPLTRTLTPSEESRVRELCGEFSVVEEEFEVVPRRPRSIIEWLDGKLPPSLLASAPRSWDTIGDVAVVEVPDELKDKEGLIAEAIMAVHPNIRAVYLKAGGVQGEYRTRPLKLIAGERRDFTLHREHGVKLYVDVENTYFSPRLATERLRVASQVSDGEVVLDMFSGVGPFAIQIASRRRALVYAVELNPRAYELLVKNIESNKLQGRVIPIMGDARRVVEERLQSSVDRVIMDLPERSLEYVDAALKALRGGGVLHVYLFEEKPSPKERAVSNVRKRIEEYGWSVREVMRVELVKQVAPRRWQVVVDAYVRSS